MINVDRGPEPAVLAGVRLKGLEDLRKLGRPPVSKEIKGYRVVSDDLWRAQHFKCCYCEQKLTSSYNDVEHYRPKARANRRPGSGEIHGYWWVAFNWDNLLFACPNCNRTEKNDLFPLRAGCVPLFPEQATPGGEHPLLIDPAGKLNPAEHIQFVPATLRPGTGVHHWWARPRLGSLYGSWTIRVCGLNHSDLLELRDDHVENFVRPRAMELREALSAQNDKDIRSALQRARELIRAKSTFSLLSYDVLRTLVPPIWMRARRYRWPDPAEIPLRPSP